MQFPIILSRILSKAFKWGIKMTRTQFFHVVEFSATVWVYLFFVNYLFLYCNSLKGDNWKAFKVTIQLLLHFDAAAVSMEGDGKGEALLGSSRLARNHAISYQFLANVHTTPYYFPS